MPVQLLIDTRDLEIVGRRLIAGAEKGEAIIVAAMPELAEKVGIVGQDMIAEVTPEETGALKGSTTREIEVEGTTATAKIKQPLVVSSQVASWILAELLIKGHDIVTRDRRVVGHVGPNPYPDEAKDGIGAEVRFLMQDEAGIIVRRYAAAL